MPPHDGIHGERLTLYIAIICLLMMVTEVTVYSCHFPFKHASNIGSLLSNIYLLPRYSWHGAPRASLIKDGGLSVLNWLALICLSRPALGPFSPSADRWQPPKTISTR
jgi:hypothetical protein